MVKMDLKTKTRVLVEFFGAIIYSYLREFFVYWNSVNIKSKYMHVANIYLLKLFSIVEFYPETIIRIEGLLLFAFSFR